jgi:hypothetical protein
MLEVCLSLRTVIQLSVLQGLSICDPEVAIVVWEAFDQVRVSETLRNICDRSATS